jgi:membrane protein YqaA with SNARE-associated domain
VRLLGFFFTWWGAYLLAVLDSSMVFFLPFGVDALVIFLAARHRELAWLYPLLATAGSVTGAAVTFWIGQKLGEIGLERYVPSRRLERLRSRVRNGGAVALAFSALLPPPFPLTPFVLTCGALRVNRWRFFTTFAAFRLLRFGTEAALALAFGLAIVGTVVSAVLLWRSTRPPYSRSIFKPG